MDRRHFLRNVALIAAGALAADQLELLERLAPRRLYFAGFDFDQKRIPVCTMADLDRLLKEVYTEPVLLQMVGKFATTPLISRVIPRNVTLQFQVGSWIGVGKSLFVA